MQQVDDADVEIPLPSLVSLWRGDLETAVAPVQGQPNPWVTMAFALPLISGCWSDRAST